MNIVQQYIGGEMGEVARNDGLQEAARRLSHALAEVAAVLETDYRSAAACREARRQAAAKARGAVAMWGVA